MQKPEEDRILPSLYEGGNASRKKKNLTESLPKEEDIEQDRRSDSESDSDSSETDSSDSSDSDDEYVCTVCDKTFSGYLPLKQHEKSSKHKKAVARKKKIKKLLNNDEEDDDNEGSLFQEPFAVCKTCDKQFTGPESYSMHRKSKAHKQKMLEASILEQVKENGEINVDKLKELSLKKNAVLGKAPPKTNTAEVYDELDAGEYECKTCEKAFTGLVPFTQHLVSKTHSRQLEKNKLMQKVVPESNTSDKASDINDVSVLALEEDILVCKACSTSFSGPESASSHLKSQKHKKKLEKYLRKLEKKKKKAIELREVNETHAGSKTNEAEEETDDSASEESEEPTSTLSGKLKETEI